MHYALCIMHFELKKRFVSRTERTGFGNSLISRFTPPDLAPCRTQVAGFHRAGPSTSLDKAYSLNSSIIVRKMDLSMVFDEIIHTSFIDFFFRVLYNRSNDFQGGLSLA